MSLIAAEVGVDRQLVAIQVVAGGLIFEAAQRASADGALRDVGKADRRVRLFLIVRVLGRRLGAPLAHPAARSVEPQPVDVPQPYAADSAVAARGDCVEPVDGQLAQALQVGAFAAETLEHYLGFLVVFSLLVEGLLLATCR